MKQFGFTLIELVLFIAIMGIAVAGVLMAYDHAARDSADPVVKKQALAIAESLLEEIQQMPFTFCDPDDPAVSTATSAAGCVPPLEAMGPEAGETRFGTGIPPKPFDNVNDYAGYDTAADGGIKDVSGTLIPELGAYRARGGGSRSQPRRHHPGERRRAADYGHRYRTHECHCDNDGYRTRYAPNRCQPPR